MLDIVTMVFESTSMRYETLVARFWLRVRRVPQSSCRRQSRDKRQELWGRECLHFCLNRRFFGVAELDNRTFQGELFFNGSSVSHVKHTTMKGNSK